MSIQGALNDANDDGFRIHQCFQRHAIGDKDVRRNWYFDVVLIHPEMWEYFHGQDESLEEAIILAHAKGTKALAKFERYSRAQKHEHRQPGKRLKADLDAVKAKEKARKRIRL